MDRMMMEEEMWQAGEVNIRCDGSWSSKLRTCVTKEKDSGRNFSRETLHLEEETSM